MMAPSGCPCAAAAASCARACAAPPIELTLDAATRGTPFLHAWKRSFGSGHASLTLREDWRSHAALAAHELGLEAVRYHGLFDDDMAVVRAPGAYDFSRLASSWDFLRSVGVRPLVELSFMPAFLANCSWHGHCKPNPVGCEGYWCTQCDGHGVGPVVNPTAPPCVSLAFHYQGIKQLPPRRDFTAWFELVFATVTYAVGRYGLEEVQRWPFEVWNELWGTPFPDDYMLLYNASAAAVKAVSASLRVGGPATAVLSHVSDFTQECKRRGVPYDFVSTHHYPTDGGSQFASKCPSGDAWDPDCFSTQVLSARQSVDGDPFFLTEYNVGCCLGYALHDTPAAAAFIFRAVGALNDHLDLYSYWTFSDVFEEGGLPRVEFKNVYGMMTIGGIRKPAWRAFQLLHTHAGDVRLPLSVSNQTAAAPRAKAQVAAFATRRSSTAALRVFLSNWGNPDAPANATAARAVRLTLLHAAGDAPTRASVEVISRSTTDPRGAWEAMGAPDVPDASQRAALARASAVGVEVVEVQPINLTASLIEVLLEENSAAVLILDS